jgi:predicted phage-related endonuclease
VAYQCQVLHQLAVTGHAWADVAVLIGGQDFRIYRVNRDEDKIADLIARETVFWQHVLMDTQPAPDGSDDAGAALSWLFPRDDGQTIDLSESIEGNRLFSALLAERQRKEDAEAGSRHPPADPERAGSCLCCCVPVGPHYLEAVQGSRCP